ncbi:MAG: sterol desaturase family protein [Ferruginibacter sp.]
MAEHILPQRKETIPFKHDALNFAIGLLNLIIAGVGGYFLQKWISLYAQNHFGFLQLIPMASWLKVLLGFILLDLYMYWWHRMNHNIKFLWRFHSFHHKDEKLNSTSALRFHAVELLLSLLVKFSIFPLLGLNLMAVLLYAMVLFPVIVLHHSNISISEKTDTLLRNIFVSPRMHRIHHSKIRMETDSNYSSVFPYWDKIFKSYNHKPVKEIEFGI